MDYEETMVENVDSGATADDTLGEEVVEEVQDESESLDSLTGEESEGTAEEPEQPAPTAKEPGWIKKRVDKAVEKAVAQTRAEMQAMFDQQMAPIKAKLMEDEAQNLVRSKKVADIETARELVRLRNGMPAEKEKTPSQQRKPNGQFAPKADPETEARIKVLQHQANKIKAGKGPDVIAEFQNNEEVRQKVINGEMDMYDVADYIKSKPSKKRPPSPMRSPNGASGHNPNAIESMTDEQFARMEKRIQEGARYKLG